MTKRILEIIVFPFSLIYHFFSLPFKIVKIFRDDKKEKKKKDTNVIFNTVSNEELSKVGNYVFPAFETEFKIFFNSYFASQKTFISNNKSLLDKYDFKHNQLKAIELIYIFGDNKQKLGIIDWRGEENEREIENFLENNLQISAVWTNTNKLRNAVDEETQTDGKFIITLLKNIDKDLEPLKMKILFFNLDWDAYVYTVISQTSYEIITKKFRGFFSWYKRIVNITKEALLLRF